MQGAFQKTADCGLQLRSVQDPESRESNTGHGRTRAHWQTHRAGGAEAEWSHQGTFRDGGAHRNPGTKIFQEALTGAKCSRSEQIL